uniref:hypothetical protein n=1 Tax=uncultured Shewanella sp. TaxID=173975 RepID=UPI0026211A31
QGVAVQYTATMYDSDNRAHDVTEQVHWVSLNPARAVMTQDGMAHTHDLLEGEATIRATYNQGTITPLTDDATLLITDAIPESLVVTPQYWETPQGVAVQYTATMYDSDNRAHDVTEQVHWVSLNPARAVMTQDGMAHTHDLLEGEATIRATYNQGTITPLTDDATLLITDAIPESLVITPLYTETIQGLSVSYTATMFDSDSRAHDVTDQVEWQSSDPTKAVMTQDGTAHTYGLASGNAVIEATYFPGTTSPLYGFADLEIKESSTHYLEIIPAIQSTPSGTEAYFEAQLTVDGNTYDVTELTHWKSSNTDHAIMDPNRPGTAITFGLTEGSTAIIATLPLTSIYSIDAEALLTVTKATPSSISITPLDSDLYLYTTVQFEAIVYYTDGTTQKNVTNHLNTHWKSENQIPTDENEHAIISNQYDIKGEAFGNSVGTSNITVTYFDPNIDPLTATTSIDVIEEVFASFKVVDSNGNSNVSMSTKSHKKLYAIATYVNGGETDVSNQVSWGTAFENPHGVVSVSNGQGKEAGEVHTNEKTGSADITAFWPTYNMWAVPAAVTVE